MMNEIKTVIIALITTVLVNKYLLKKQYQWLDDFFKREEELNKNFISKFLKDFAQKE